MRTSGIVCSLLVVCSIGSAQVETLAGEEYDNGGFGGPVVKVTSLNGQTGMLIGARGGWIINHTFILGAAGYELLNDVNATSLGPADEPYIDFKYGGLQLEYVANWDRLLHYSVGLLVGGGMVGFRALDGSASGNTNGFFAAEPWVDANLNVTSFFQVSAGASYLWVSGANSLVAADGDLSGLALNLTLRFGSF